MYRYVRSCRSKPELLLASVCQRAVRCHSACSPRSQVTAHPAVRARQRRSGPGRTLRWQFLARPSRKRWQHARQHRLWPIRRLSRPSPQQEGAFFSIPIPEAMPDGSHNLNLPDSTSGAVPQRKMSPSLTSFSHIGRTAPDSGVQAGHPVDPDLPLRTVQH